MNYYSLSMSAHAKSSWALHEISKRLPNRPKREGLAPVFYKFFPSEDVEVRMKPLYRHLCCVKCGRYDSEKMFSVGFDDPVTMRFKGDYGHTKDRIFTINDKYLKILKQAKVGGYETIPLGKSGWHALQVTLLVNHADGVVKSRKPVCSECGQPKESFGLFEYLRQLSLPTQANTFFTTKTSWPSRHGIDRDILITENVLRVLKAGGIAGGYCTRLLSDEELKKQKEKAKQGISFWTPPGTSVHLNGKV